MMTKRWNTILMAAAAALLGACDATHTLGGEKPDGQDPTGAAGTGAAGAGPDGTLSWSGRLESYAFQSGSHAVELTYSIDGDGRVVGTIVFGQGTPAARDQSRRGVSARRPHDLWRRGRRIPRGLPLLLLGRPAIQPAALSGWDFTGVEGLVRAADVLLSDRVCVPSEISRTNYEVNPNTCEVAGPNPNQWTPVDCEKAGLCLHSHPCECDATSCHAATKTWGPSFDLRIVGDTASGESYGEGVDSKAEFTKNP